MVPSLLAAGAWLERLERDLLHAITCTWHDETLGWVLIEVQRKGVGIPIALAGLGLLAWRRGRALAGRVLATAALGFLLCSALAAGLWPVVARERPPHHYERLLRTPAEQATCAQDPGALALRNPRVSHSWSFPSRHGITAGVVVTAFWLAGWRWGLLALPFGFLVAWGRLYAGRHWPTDVLAGVLLGVGGAWLAWRWVPGLLGRLRRGRRAGGGAGDGAKG